MSGIHISKGGWNVTWGPAKIRPTFNLLKWWKSWASSQRNQCRSSSDQWWDFWDDWFVSEFMSVNVDGRFEYEMCFHKIHSSIVDRGWKNHLNVCYGLREQVGNNLQILSKVVTRDETWCYGYDPKTKQASSQWKTPNSPKAKKAQQVWSNVKIMLISFFDANGIVHKEFLPPGQTVNQQFYLKVLKRLCNSVQKKRPEMWCSGDWLLYHDNAPAHTALSV